jgi:hypothetical protein
MRASSVAQHTSAFYFAAHFVATGAPADRNAGFGLLAEWRALLWH